LEVIWKEVVVAYPRYKPDILLQELIKTMKNHNQNILYPGRNDNLPNRGLKHGSYTSLLH
jgi:hypothetical protein